MGFGLGAGSVGPLGGGESSAPVSAPQPFAGMSNGLTMDGGVVTA
ncbi:MAG TPA: hypothetical protein VFB06_32520 [Streptosporangiaceae bacterium]|nr:hypothetical protein [Streptosporangiaceae bacterium]